MKCGWVPNTTDINQLEFLKVTSAPVPALLPEKASINWKNLGSLQVTVKDSHFDSSTLSANSDGCPKSGSFLAIFSHRVHVPSALLLINFGARSIDPRLASAVIEPLVTNTRSSLPRAMLSAFPFWVKWMRSTAFFPRAGQSPGRSRCSPFQIARFELLTIPARA